MSALAKKAREENKARASRMAGGDPHQKVDASSWSEGAAMNNGTQTGEKPISPKAYARGGRTGFASGGMTASEYENRNVKSANSARPGKEQMGGYRDGGRARAHKLYGGAMGMPQRPMMPPMQRMVRASGGKVHEDEAQDRKLIKHFMHGKGCECAKCSGGRVGRDSGGRVGHEFKSLKSAAAQKLAGSAMRMAQKQGVDPQNSQPSQAGAYKKLWSLGRGRIARAKGGTVVDGGSRPVGGRMARASGGKAKKGMNVNIIITQPGGQGRPPMPPPGMPAPPPGAPGPLGMHQGMPPPPPPAGAPPPMGGAPPMMRKHGGRTYPLKDGAGGGKGRLQKIAAYG